jgi:hypothetical protein
MSRSGSGTGGTRVDIPVHCPARMTSEKQETQFIVHVISGAAPTASATARLARRTAQVWRVVMQSKRAGVTAPAYFVANVAGGGGRISKEQRPTRWVVLTQLGRPTQMVARSRGRQDDEGDGSTASFSLQCARLG